MSERVIFPRRVGREPGPISVRLVPEAQAALDASKRRDGDRTTDVINRAVILYNTIVQAMHDQEAAEIQVGEITFLPEGVLEK